MTQTEIQKDALNRAVGGNSLSNYEAIYNGFKAKGIPESEIKPRENIFTYHAWRAIGRQVRKGEKGVKIGTYRSYSKTVNNDDGTKTTVNGARPTSTTVFHISQTDLTIDNS